MWFRFPAGTDQISIEQQTFQVEAKDKDGNGLFRAPDHFAPTILGLPGYGRGEPPEDAPEDLPPSDPKRASEIDKLTAQREADREEIERLRQQLGEAWRTADGHKVRVAELEADNKELREEISKAQADLTKAKSTGGSGASQNTSGTQQGNNPKR